MAYTKQNFEDGQILKAEHLNKMEEGIEDVSKIVLREKSDTLTWDGNTEGRSVFETAYKVSDVVLAPLDFTADTIITVTENGETGSVRLLDLPSETQWDAIMFLARDICVVSIGDEAAEQLGVEPGTYLHPDVSALTIPGYTGFVTEKLDPAYLPDVSGIPASWIAALKTAMGIS